MKVLFGIGFGGNPTLLRGGDASTFMELVRMAEGYGAAAIGTYDSAFLGGDAYVRAGDTPRQIFARQRNARFQQ